MRIIILSLFLIVVSSCDKQNCIVHEELATDSGWLEQQKQSLVDCTCLTAIYKGTYQGETVYEVRVIDPLCNGVNSVYKVDGTPVVNSSQQSAYAIYIVSVQNLQQIWKCK